MDFAAGSPQHSTGPRRREWQPTPVFLPGESHGWRSLAGYNPWGRKESDTTEQLHSLWPMGYLSTVSPSEDSGDSTLMTHSGTAGAPT